MDIECRLCSYLRAHVHTDFDDLMKRVGLLTPRERDVLDLLGPGLSTSEIASTLRIHPSTVKVHLRSTLTKLETDRRTAGLIVLLFHDGQCPELASSPDRRRPDRAGRVGGGAAAAPRSLQRPVMT